MRRIKRNWLRAAVAALSALLACMVVLNIARSEELQSARTRISAVYQKAFYETCELTEAVSGNYRKLLVAADAAQMQALLNEISRQTQGAASNLALLPLGEETISATIKFINQAEDFAESLSAKIASGGEASAADYAAMQALSDGAAGFSSGLSRLLERYERGEAIFSAEDFAETGDETLYPLTGDAGQYPVLLYDGPFSDGALVGDYEWIAEKPEIDASAAEARLRAFLPVDELTLLGESHPEVDIYEFRIRSGEYWISAGVTKKGGEILYLLPENGEDEIVLPEAEICEIARDFLKRQGYGDMEMSYSSRFGGILTINFAARQDGIILYSDLVKIQLSMKDGRVIGLDAKSYLRNHRVRSLIDPAITEEEALRRAGDRITPSSARLCLIPQNRREYLCYEISATDGIDDFLVYIDAQSGVERDLMQVVSIGGGTLVI